MSGSEITLLKLKCVRRAFKCVLRGDVKMAQYCRYCINAEDYNGEGEDFMCFADAPCGKNGEGRFYKAAKAKRINHCKHYDGPAMDIFSLRAYQPKGPRTPSKYEQMKLL